MTMRSASFFFLSLSLHAAALAYPVTFAGRHHGEALRVTLLPGEQESVRAGRGAAGSPVPKRKSASIVGRLPAAGKNTAAESSKDAPEPPIVTPVRFGPLGESGVASISAIGAPSNSGVDGAWVPTSLTGLGGASGAGETGGGGSGLGAGDGSGDGAGSGSASRASAEDLGPTQARPQETPRPEYPDSARRQRQEGRVLLRVLIDDQGRSKQVEIHSSSGSDALDRAAVEAIRRWRFYPARYGHQPIESWLRIPVAFRLTDASSR